MSLNLSSCSFFSYKMGIFIFSLLILRVVVNISRNNLCPAFRIKFFKVQCKFKTLPWLCSLYSLSKSSLSIILSLIHLLMSPKFKAIFSIFSLNFIFLFSKVISQCSLVPQIQCIGTSCNNRNKYEYNMSNLRRVILPCIYMYICNIKDISVTKFDL